MEKFINGFWIFEFFKVFLLLMVGFEFYFLGCVYSLVVLLDGRGMYGRRLIEFLIIDIRDKGIILFMKEVIEYFCGVGGVRLGLEGMNEFDYGFVSFQRDGFIVIVVFIGLEDNGVVQEILYNVE